MKNTMITLSVVLAGLVSCNSHNLDLSKVQWVPTYLDIAQKDDVRIVLLAEDYGRTTKCPGKPEDWGIVVVINDVNKIAKIQDALHTTEPDIEEMERLWDIHPDWKVSYYKYGGWEWDCWMGLYTEKILFIDDSNNGFILGCDSDGMSKKVRFCGGSSEKLYEIIADPNFWDVIFQDEKGLKDIGIVDINWLPTFEDFECKGTEDIKILVFLEDDADEPENCTEIGRITDPQKIKEFMDVLDEDLKEPVSEGKIVNMAIINKENQGLIRKMTWDYTNKRVHSYQHYSERAFKILEELEIISSEKRP